MKITICNLGAVKEARIDLKPLTVFIGENGTGKTWAAYTIAGILGEYGFNYYKNEYMENRTEFRYEPLEKAVAEFAEKGNAKINIIEFTQNFIEIYMNETAKLAPEWINSFMASKRIKCNDMKIHIDLSEDMKQQIVNGLKFSAVTKEIGIGADSSISLNLLKEHTSDELYYYMKYESHNSGEIPSPVINREIRDFVVSETFGMIREVIFQNTPVFPTERTALITFPFASSVPYENREKYKSRKKEQSKAGEQSWISEPVKNFLGILSASLLKEHFNRKTQQIHNPKITEFIKLANFLENDILLGNIDFEQYGDKFELIYKVSENTNLELNVSSSMVKELAPLALYLKFLAQPGDLLVIDEPEMNLHPGAQVEITEFLAMMVNTGLNVLITTHSPYIVDHLANLMQAAKSDDKEKISQMFYLERTEAFIEQDKISICLFENGTVRNIVDEKGVIDWSTFGNVSSDVAAIYSRLI